MHAARAVREENLRFQELYRLANEQFFEYSIKSDTLRISKSKSLLSSSYVDDATSMDDGSSYVSYETHASSSSTVRTPSCWMRSPRRRTP